MSSFPCLVRNVSGSGQVRYSLGERLVDRYLEFVAGRCRPNTLRAVAFDLKAFFTVIPKDPVAVTAADVFDFLADQRGDRTVVRLAGREPANAIDEHHLCVIGVTLDPTDERRRARSIAAANSRHIANSPDPASAHPGPVDRRQDHRSLAIGGITAAFPPAPTQAAPPA